MKRKQLFMVVLAVLTTTAATAFNARLKTLITTIATSTELQRIYSSKPNVFNLSESDFTQCYMMLGGILLEGKTHISLITSDDIYGQSFSDWFGYSATEMGMTIDLLGIYRTQEKLRQLIAQWQGGLGKRPATRPEHTVRGVAADNGSQEVSQVPFGD